MSGSSGKQRIVRRASVALCVLVVASTLGGCAGFTRWPWGTTQRWPPPMQNTVDPLPAGQAEYLEEGPEEVLLLRHADPVRVRPAGLTGGYPLTFYDKSVRVRAGSGVGSAPGGRIEVVWPNGNSIVLFDACVGVVGSPSKGQASFLFLTVDGAQIDLKVPDQVQLPTGARLSAARGVFRLDRIGQDVVRVSNRSKGPGEILFRDTVITLDGGQIVDLPLLSAGGRPEEIDPSAQRAQVNGTTLSWSGQVELSKEDNGAVRLRSMGDHEVKANGVRVRMQRDETVRFDGLGTKPAAAPPQPQPESQSQPSPQSPPSSPQSP